jgi:type IV secretory pathway VirB10-like protein
MSDNETADTGTDGAAFETTAEDATGFGRGGGPGFFNRKRVLIVICIAFAAVVGGGLLLNLSRKSAGSGEQGAPYTTAARPQTDLLRSQLTRSMQNAPGEGADGEEGGAAPLAETGALPDASWIDASSPAAMLLPQAPTPQAPPPAGAPGASTSAPAAPAQNIPQTYYASPLTPRIEGSVFQAGAAGAYQAAGQAPPGSASDEYLRYLMAQQGASPQASYPGYGTAQDPYAAQNAQDNKQAFYAGGGDGGGGYYIADGTLWIGTVIPGVLVTGVNTDLPGSITARVTENVYDSRTGTRLLIPQGTLLTARYNSSVSYAQHRVQIAWDTLIRPDGFMVDLGGMNGVDGAGMSGQEAQYHENWFEYLKAAGIITLFTVASGSIAQEAAALGPGGAAQGIAQANAEFVSQAGGSIVSRAINIQPTLTVEPGTRINIMLSRNLWLPSLDDYPVTQKYTLER